MRVAPNLLFLILLPMLAAGAVHAADDRHEGYYYPGPVTSERYVGRADQIANADRGQRLGFITPMTHNFCESCNRVRLTCTGTLYMCLGQDDAADLRTALRTDPSGALLDATIDEAIGRKPKGHDFIIDRRQKQPAVSRHMSVTGG